MDGLVQVGEVVRPHGIRGEVVVVTSGDSLAGLPPDAPVWLGDPPRRYCLQRVRPHGNRLLLWLDGVADRNLAETLRGAPVWLRPEQRSDPGPDEAWVEELVGARLLRADGSEVGTVTGVLEAPAQDLLRIDTARGEALVPMVRHWLRHWDRERRELVMDLPAGLVPGPGTD